MYVIWHDNDYDFAKWVYENSNLSNKEIIFRLIPKSKEGLVEENKFIQDSDYHILPIVKLATPDIIIQKIEEKKSKIIFVSEFMTHTPQHDHVFQRFERIFCVSKERIPIALILPKTKVKLERGNRGSYKEVRYHPTPLTVHTYLKTTLINKNPTLMFFWPEEEGYLKYDSKHQTAPKVEGDIKLWLEFLNESLLEKAPEELSKSVVVKKKIRYLLENYLLNNNEFYSVTHNDLIKNLKNYYNLDRVKIINTKDAVNIFNLNKRELNKDFLSREKSVVFEYNSKKFRTDPYCGFICGYINLLCTDNQNKRTLNLIHVPKGILYNEVAKTNNGGKKCFTKIKEDLSKCPLYSLSNFNNTSIDDVKKHLKICIYTKSKQQRIYGTLPDIIVFDDEVYYVK